MSLVQWVLPSRKHGFLVGFVDEDASVVVLPARHVVAGATLQLLGAPLVLPALATPLRLAWDGPAPTSTAVRAVPLTVDLRFAAADLPNGATKRARSAVAAPLLPAAAGAAGFAAVLGDFVVVVGALCAAAGLPAHSLTPRDHTSLAVVVAPQLGPRTAPLTAFELARRLWLLRTAVDAVARQRGFVLADARIHVRATGTAAAVDHGVDDVIADALALGGAP